ncbi:MAG: bifunctional oligoribonuclease/PAP phosphatase NrnA [Clostridiales bacterium]|jgi:phosphoesterase RecJ-like protein|nr:bifunctional oligoribonuclease/PAP phosphatase NrnA [Clostridiales bacterium]
MNETELIKKAASAIKNAERVAIFCHTRPDGDTLGSGLGLKAALGDKADVYCDSEISDYYDVFPNRGDVVPFVDVKGPYDLMVAVDCADPPRLGRYEREFLKAKNTVVIDHHVTNPGFGAVNCILPAASSTGEIMLRVIREITGGALGRLSALCLYVGVSTDTGNFTHGNTAPSTFRAAADLVSFGVDVAAVADKLYKETTLNRIKLLAAVLSALSLREGGRVAVLRVTRDMLKMYDCKPYDTEGFVDYAINLKGVLVGLMIHETGANRYKVSLRSKAPVNVAEAASRFGGGGHAQAAGCQIQGEYYGVEDKILRAVGEEIGLDER